MNHMKRALFGPNIRIKGDKNKKAIDMNRVDDLMATNNFRSHGEGSDSTEDKMHSEILF